MIAIPNPTLSSMLRAAMYPTPSLSSHAIKWVLVAVGVRPLAPSIFYKCTLFSLVESLCAKHLASQHEPNQWRPGAPVITTLRPPWSWSAEGLAQERRQASGSAPLRMEAVLRRSPPLLGLQQAERR
jgi:hypothetical protein